LVRKPLKQWEWPVAVHELFEIGEELISGFSLSPLRRVFRMYAIPG
jgi:hypothetical protein